MRGRLRCATWALLALVGCGDPQPPPAVEGGRALVLAGATVVTMDGEWRVWPAGSVAIVGD
ncbi:MAG: hypothetical protein R3190_09530, partial [Thermoanaerobaculia bacterium]|nr:hypothetical protein [Thermoanaerobaculia bacterium]